MDLVPTSRYGYSDVPVEQPESLYIPRSAVLMAGSNSVVYVETEPGRFEIRPVVIGPILKDKVVILGGLKDGEQVATAGNFLIDSQMQLAGKPSLIDPTRALVKQQERNEPLEFAEVHVEPIGSEAGRKLEQLYVAYFSIQESLASDQKPSEQDSVTLHQIASELAGNADLPDSVRQLLVVIAEKSEHLHHLEIEPARLQAFRPISHAVVTLSTQVRGGGATGSFSHMFCPMVKGGGGDWLQSGGELRKPLLGQSVADLR